MRGQVEIEAGRSMQIIPIVSRGWEAAWRLGSGVVEFLD